MTVTAVSAPSRRFVVGLVLTLALAGLVFVFGRGIASATLPTYDGSGWLANGPRGSVSLVDSVSGRPSAEIVLPGTGGHRLQISQDGDAILVYDPVTGVLTRIDAGRLSVGAARAAAPGVRLVAGRSAAFLVNYQAGTVQAIDVNTLRNLGPVIRLPGRLGAGGVDGQGTLWMPRADDGVVIPVTAAGAGTPVDVQGRGSELAVSIVGGRPVVVDATQARVSAVTTAGVAWSVALPGVTAAARLLAPGSEDQALLPLVDQASGRLIIVDTGGHGVTSVPLAGGGSFGAPVTSGDRIYVPDVASGSVLVYSTTGHAWEPSFPVGGKAGPIDTLLKNGSVYFNDPQDANAVVVGPDGTPRPVEKYTPGQDKGGKTPPARQALPGSGGPGSGMSPGQGGAKRPGPGFPPTPAHPSNGPSSGPLPTPPVVPAGPPVTASSAATPAATPAPTPAPTPTATPTPTPVAPRPPGRPRGVAATAQAGGSVTVSWTPPGGAPKDVSYTVSYSGGGTSGSATTAGTVLTVGADRLTFLGTYTFSVRAGSAGGESGAATATARSGGDGRSFIVDVSKTRTDPVNPCTNLAVCRATMRQSPTHTSAQTGIAPQGSTVVGYCHEAGQSIGNDDGVRSTQWILIISGGHRGFVSTLWLGGASAYQSLWPCP